MTDHCCCKHCPKHGKHTIKKMISHSLEKRLDSIEKEPWMERELQQMRERKESRKTSDMERSRFQKELDEKFMDQLDLCVLRGNGLIDEYVLQVVDKNGTGSDEFKKMVSAFGLEKLRQAYARALKRRSIPDSKKLASGDKE